MPIKRANAFPVATTTTTTTTTVIVAIAGLLVLLALAPLRLSDYGLSFLVNLISAIVLATAWRMFAGPTRYVSLAVAAFFGIGAYTVALVQDILPLYAAFALAGLAGMLVALLVGLTTLRVSGVHFVIFTFGLGELIREVTIWWEINQTRTVGRYVLVDFDTPLIYWSLLALMVLVFATGHWLERSRPGFALRVIGEDEAVADQVGIDRAAVKVAVFVLSAFFLTMVGALMAPRWSYINPNTVFGATISFQVVIMALLGGMQRLWGPLLGVVPMTVLSEILSTNYPRAYSVILGAVFLISVYVLPDGIAGLIERGWARARRRRDGAAPGDRHGQPATLGEG